MLRAGLFAAIRCRHHNHGAISFDRISPESLRATVTWLAADQRQGRMTPSPGLEASADYLANRFQQSGLAPGGQDGTYFQTAAFARITPQLNDFRLTLEGRTHRATAGPRAVTVHSLAGIDYRQEPILRLHGSVPDIAGEGGCRRRRVRTRRPACTRSKYASRR